MAETKKPRTPKARTKKADTDAPAEAKIALAKEGVKEAAPPAKRAERLMRLHPELADESWVRGNPEAVQKLTG